MKDVVERDIILKFVTSLISEKVLADNADVTLSIYPKLRTPNVNQTLLLLSNAMYAGLGKFETELNN